MSVLMLSPGIFPPPASGLVVGRVYWWSHLRRGWLEMDHHPHPALWSLWMLAAALPVPALQQDLFQG